MKILQSGEDYLEAILQIKKEKGKVRSIDIAKELNFSKASVSIAMKKLRESNYIEVDSNGLIELTDSGYKIATTIYERHELLINILISLGVSPEQAKIDACKIEHNISEESFDAIKKHIQK
jgi:Mn-dependent DtxR family transcriptional regulator